MLTRCFDVLATLIGLVCLGPVLLLITAVVRFADGGPSLFRQRRVGRGGRVFTLYKFRSMSVDPGGGALTVGADPRVTRAGRWLRATKLDELPQLFNVLRGDMGLVGPRPEVESYVALYTPAQRAVLELRPGVTDPASFAFYDESALLARRPDPERFYRDVLINEKIRINLEYAARRTFFTDWILIFATVLKPLGVRIDIFHLFNITPPRPEIFA